MTFHLNTTNLRLLPYLDAANKLGALPAGAGLWHVPGHGVRATGEMVRVAGVTRPSQPAPPQ